MEEFTYNDVVKYSTCILHPGDNILPCTAYAVSNNEKPTQYEYVCMYLYTECTVEPEQVLGIFTVD